MIYSFNLSIRQNPNISWRVPPKIYFLVHFSLVSLSPHTRSRPGAERIRQGEGRWGRPSKTALERSDLIEKFEVREFHTKAETKKAPRQYLSSKKNTLFYICTRFPFGMRVT